MSEHEGRVSYDLSSTENAEVTDKRDMNHPPVAISAPHGEYNNPQNWSSPKKIAVTAILGNMVLSLTYSSSAYSSSAIKLQEHYHVSQEVIFLGISLYVLGFGLGPLLWGPLAQIFGKRPVYLVTYAMFAAFLFGVSEANNIGTLLVCRFLAGTSGSSSFNNVPASMADYAPPIKAFRYLSYFALTAFGGPALGPIISAFIDHRAGFRWNLRVQAIYVAVSFLLCLLFVPETHHAILRKKIEEDSEGQTKPNTRIRSFLSSFSTLLVQQFVCLFKEPVVAFICFYLSMLYGVLYAFFEVFPYVFMGIRHFTEEKTGLVFIANLVGFLCAQLILDRVQQPYIEKQWASLTANTRLDPEHRLRQSLWATFLPAIGLFIFAWTAPFEHVHWIAPLIGMFLFSFGMMLIFTALIPYLLEYAGPDAPILLAASAFTRSTFAAGFPLFSVQMYKKMSVQGGTSMLAGLCLLIAPLSWVLYLYGPKLRSMSKHSRRK